MRYYIYKDGNVVGPFEPAQMPQLGVTPQSQVCIEGANEWHPASAFSELAPIFPNLRTIEQRQTHNGAIGLILSLLALIGECVFLAELETLSWPTQLIASLFGIVGLVFCIVGFKEKSKIYSILGLVANVVGVILSIVCYWLLLAKASVNTAVSMYGYF